MFDTWKKTFLSILDIEFTWILVRYEGFVKWVAGDPFRGYFTPPGPPQDPEGKIFYLSGHPAVNIGAQLFFNDQVWLCCFRGCVRLCIYSIILIYFIWRSPNLAFTNALGPIHTIVDEKTIGVLVREDEVPLPEDPTFSTEGFLNLIYTCICIFFNS